MSKYEYGKSFENNFDSQTGELNHGGNKVDLPSKQLAIFKILIENYGNIVEKQKIFDQCWSTFVSDNVLAVQIGRLCKTLGDREIIHGVRGRGYKFMAPCRLANAAESTKQGYSFITNLKNIYHLTTKGRQIRLAKGWINIDYNRAEQTITGKEETNIEEKNTGNRGFKIKGYVENNYLFYRGISDWVIGGNEVGYSATFFYIGKQYNISHGEEICGIMVCNNSFNYNEEYIAPILLRTEQLSDNVALSSLYRISQRFRLLGRKA